MVPVIDPALRQDWERPGEGNKATTVGTCFECETSRSRGAVYAFCRIVSGNVETRGEQIYLNTFQCKHYPFEKEHI